MMRSLSATSLHISRLCLVDSHNASLHVEVHLAGEHRYAVEIFGLRTIQIVGEGSLVALNPEL